MKSKTYTKRWAVRVGMASPFWWLLTPSEKLDFVKDFLKSLNGD